MPDQTNTDPSSATTDDSDTSGDATSTTPDTTETDGIPAELGDAGKRALAAERERAKAAEQRAKALEQENEKLRLAQMSEQEKAIEEARALGRAEGRAEVAPRLVSAAFKAEAAGRLDAKQLDALLSVANLETFLTEDGQVNEAKVRELVDSFASSSRRPVDLGQGARGTVPVGGDMNSAIRRAAGRH